MTTALEALQTNLDERPSSERLSVDGVLAEFPQLQHDPQARELVAIEAYVRSLDGASPLSSNTAAWLPADLKTLEARLRSAGLAEELRGSDGSDPLQKLRAGDVVGGCQLIRELGRGAFARVFLAADLNVGNRRVAVKLSRHPSEEAALLATVQHPNLPRILAAQQDDRTQLHVLCMEFAGTETLAACINHGGGGEWTAQPAGSGVPGEMALAILSQLADALQHAHDLGLLHLDVKPANVVMKSATQPVLVDFNLGTNTTRAGDVGYRGTSAYAAPELLEAIEQCGLTAAPVGPASDVYSLAVLGFELLTGRLPWQSPELLPGRDFRQWLHARREAPRLSAIDARLPAGFDRVFAQALAFDVRDRYASAAEFQRALSAAAAPHRPVRRHSARKVSLAASLVLALLCLMFWPAGADLHPDAARRGLPPRVGTTAPDEIPQPVQLAVSDWDRPALERLRQRLAESASAHDPETVAAAEGVVLMLLEDYRGAVPLLRGAVMGRFAGNAGLQCDLAYCYLQRRIYQASMRVLEPLWDVAPHDEPALFLLAGCESELVRLGQPPADLIWRRRLSDLSTATAQSALGLLARRHPESTDPPGAARAIAPLPAATDRSLAWFGFGVREDPQVLQLLESVARERRLP